MRLNWERQPTPLRAEGLQTHPSKSEGSSHEEQTRALSLEKRRVMSDLAGGFSIVTRGSRGAGTIVFALMTSDRTQETSGNLHLTGNSD